MVQMVHRFPPSLKWILNNPMRRFLAKPDTVLSKIGIKPGMTVVEVGSGPGFYTLEAATLVGEKGRIYALDIEPKMIQEVCRNLSRYKINNVITLIAPANATDLPDSCIDLVYVFYVYHEISEKEEAIREFSRILKREGILAIRDVPLFGVSLLDTIKTVTRFGFKLLDQRDGYVSFSVRFWKEEEIKNESLLSHSFGLRRQKVRGCRRR